MIALVPSDILVRVFEEFLPDPFSVLSDAHPSPRISPLVDYMCALTGLGLVCSHWRNTSLGAPHLWSHIEVDLDWLTPPPSHLSMVEMCLGRAKFHPLSVWLVGSDTSLGAITDTSALDLVMSFSNRWKYLYFSVTQPSYQRLTSITGNLASLETVVVSGYPYWDQNLAVFEVAPRLRNVSLLSAIGGTLWKFPWSQLVTYRIHSSSLLTTLSIKFFSKYTQLTHFELGGRTTLAVDENDLPTEPVRVPLLKSLMLTSVIPPIPFLDYLVLPNLESLYLFEDDQVVSHAIALLERSSSPLKELTLNHGHREHLSPAAFHPTILNHLCSLDLNIIPTAHFLNSLNLPALESLALFKLDNELLHHAAALLTRSSSRLKCLVLRFTSAEEGVVHLLRHTPHLSEFVIVGPVPKSLIRKLVYTCDSQSDSLVPLLESFRISNTEMVDSLLNDTTHLFEMIRSRSVAAPSPPATRLRCIELFLIPALDRVTYARMLELKTLGVQLSANDPRDKIEHDPDAMQLREWRQEMTKLIINRSDIPTDEVCAACTYIFTPTHLVCYIGNVTSRCVIQVRRRLSGNDRLMCFGALSAVSLDYRAYDDFRFVVLGYRVNHTKSRNSRGQSHPARTRGQAQVQATSSEAPRFVENTR